MSQWPGPNEQGWARTRHPRKGARTLWRPANVGTLVIEPPKFETFGFLKGLHIALSLVTVILFTGYGTWSRPLVGTNKAMQEIYRLIDLAAPTARQRPLPIQAFLEEFNAKYQRRIRPVDEAAQQLLLGHAWPGNVRELRNTLERAVITSEGELITRAHLPPSFAGQPRVESPTPSPCRSAPPSRRRRRR